MIFFDISLQDFTFKHTTRSPKPHPPPHAFQELRRHFERRREDLPLFRGFKKMWVIYLFFSKNFFSEALSGCCSRLVCPGAAKRLRHSQTDKITHLHLQQVSLLPPHHHLHHPPRTSILTLTLPNLLTFSSPCSRAQPSAALAPPSADIFRSHKCRVTEGSTSSQQSGLKFNESLDAYFIVLRPPSITLYIPQAARLSSPFLFARDLPPVIRPAPRPKLIALMWRQVIETAVRAPLTLR